ncbi:hypothetical protein RCL_jg2994.t1 [Rhizophagus clarus]|uniref:Uncharacterized protein n=1 Tax=Rhizophagus clarus TaxID=94130 RepID=A0A8H3R1N0_9GLOM|nr:hypothetical protein RCL_jg2994.t1 [Rhizophagus clarus]
MCIVTVSGPRNIHIGLVARPFPFVPFLSIGFFFSHSSPFPITFLFSRLFRLIQISAEQPDLWTRGDLVARTFIAKMEIFLSLSGRGNLESALDLDHQFFRSSEQTADMETIKR